MKLALGLYGLYLLLVAIKGNGETFAQKFQADAPGFLPWLVAAAVLGALYNNDRTHALAGAFLFLAALTFLTKNFNTLKQQFGSIYQNATSGASGMSAAASPMTSTTAAADASTLGATAAAASAGTGITSTIAASGNVGATLNSNTQFQNEASQLGQAAGTISSVALGSLMGVE